MACAVERRATEAGGHGQATGVMVSVKCVLWWPCLALRGKEPLRQPETPTRVQSWVGGGDRQHARPGDDSVPQPPVHQGPSKGTPVHLRELCSQPRVDASEEACAESGLGGRRLPPRGPNTSLRTQLELVPGPLGSSRGPPAFVPQTPHTSSHLATQEVCAEPIPTTGRNSTAWATWTLR